MKNDMIQEHSLALVIACRTDKHKLEKTGSNVCRIAHTTQFAIVDHVQNSNRCETVVEVLWTCYTLRLERSK